MDGDFLKYLIVNQNFQDLRNSLKSLSYGILIFVKLIVVRLRLVSAKI